MSHLKQKVYYTLANHPRCLVSGISNILNEPNKEVRRAIRALRQDGIIDSKRRIVKPTFIQLELYGEN